MRQSACQQDRQRAAFLLLHLLASACESSTARRTPIRGSSGKSHGHVPASTREILGLYQIAHPVGAARDSLQDFQRKPDRCLARPVVSNEQHGRHARERQLEVFQATKVMNVEAAYHKGNDTALHGCAIDHPFRNPIPAKLNTLWSSIFHCSYFNSSPRAFGAVLKTVWKGDDPQPLQIVPPFAAHQVPEATGVERLDARDAL